MNFRKLRVPVLVAAILCRVGPLGSAETNPPLVLQLDSPLDYQVVQRRTRTEGLVPIRGRAPAGTERVEVQLGGDWLPAELTQTDGVFVAEVKVASGGWYVCRVRATAKGQTGDEASPDIRAAQASLWKDRIALEGPDSDALKGKLRERNGQGVHFSGEGLRVHAAKWAEKISPWIEQELNKRQGASRR